MTPAINQAKKAKVTYQVHEYAHDPRSESYGEEAAQAMGAPAERVFKTLLVSLTGGAQKLAVGIVPVSGKLDLKAVAKALGAKKAEMADPKEAERATGYIVGGISPLGQKKRLPTVLDDSSLNYATIFVSAGKRGLEIELAPQDLLSLTGGVAAAIGVSD
ncbi:Cys-tRNA(Pro) deacylase [Hahella sp. KA22]|uniref:Cys-tRNA(Pro) deacylase n=1 Tax=Hahella sp. KA22 TaxID=1628392 RepID=UPI000FDE5F04|nr:Cys-tRNA(Pro) deacylase [Hahella sp. KA22]AZZ93540.1 Cys-tRNA(Pro) deacylase [Hahella sp. KA22]QAY56915.1 Cys-tRNA(Pro) deacylase [Hahella sp. KA22]